MVRVAKWFGVAAATLAGLALLVATGIVFVSGLILGRGYEAKAETLGQPTREQLADAERQARIRGCVTCHGEGLRGQVMADIPNVVRVNAPNLTEVAAHASDQQLAAAVRQGIGHDGRALFVMPSPMYARMSDAETAALIRWIRKQPRVEGRSEGFSVGPLGRVAVVTGKLRAAPAKLVEFKTQEPIRTGPAHTAGHRLATGLCTDCHGPALYGQTMEDGTVTPDLRIAGAYNLDQFRTLMRTGTTPAGKKLGLMKKVAEKDFSNLNEAEVQALHAYLGARAEKVAD